MRLESTKISNFRRFGPTPTKTTVSSEIMAIVGPNGTGMRRLAVRKKAHFPNSTYGGTVHSLTPLGARVRDLLKAKKAI